MEKNVTHTQHFSRTNLFRSSLVIAFLCIASAFSPLTTTAHAASSAQLSTTYKTAATQSVPGCPGCIFAFSDNLYSAGDNLYVNTEVNNYGPKYAELQADSKSVGTSNAYNWYEDTNILDGNNSLGHPYVIQSQANGLYVSAELTYGGTVYGMLRARASTAGPWERFWLDTDLFCNPVISNCYGSIQSDANGLYVSAELGYTHGDYGMLRARAGKVGPWEYFYI